MGTECKRGKLIAAYSYTRHHKIMAERNKKKKKKKERKEKALIKRELLIVHKEWGI